MSQKTSEVRVAAIVGGYTVGKTALVESLLYVTGVLERKGTAAEASRVGDAGTENAKRHSNTETVVSATTFLGEPWVFLDCPGSVEFLQQTYDALAICDVAVVVCDADPVRAVTVTPLLKYLEERDIPHLVFINKVENAKAPIKEIMSALQQESALPLVLREVPIRENDTITGYVDLISNRAYAYKDGEYSADNVSTHLVKIPETAASGGETARREMLESLADFNDALLEKLLEDAVVCKEDVFEGVTSALSDNKIVPVFFGAAEQDAGVFRLLKTLRHDIVSMRSVSARRGSAEVETAMHVFKTYFAPHTGKQSFVRVLAGSVVDGASAGGEKINGLYRFDKTKLVKAEQLSVGEIGVLGRLESAATGDLLTLADKKESPLAAPSAEPVTAVALKTKKTGEEVKLSGAVAKLAQEDKSYVVEFNADTGQLLLWGQGSMHLETALSRLETRFNVGAEGTVPKVPYKETIRAGVKCQGKHKRQSGGHGQYGDVWLEIRPLDRGQGFVFDEKIVGGAIPKQYFSAIEAGVREALKQGVFGCPVVDVGVTLVDGSYHDVDSSDQAFKTAAAIAVRDGLKQCHPVLLEPLLKVSVSVPQECTSKVQRVLSQCRGQILGFGARDGWTGWEQVQAFLPLSEMFGFVIDLRSLSMGVGAFEWQIDRLQELTGKDADKVVAALATKN